MPGTPYSVDFRERVLALHDKNGWTREETAENFAVGPATIYRWLALRRAKGNVDPLPHRGGPGRAVGPKEEPLLRELVDEKPDRTLVELGVLLAKRIGRARPFGEATICRALQRLQLTLKKSRWSRPSRTAPTSSSGGPSSRKKPRRSRRNA
jgi:transposase